MKPGDLEERMKPTIKAILGTIFDIVPETIRDASLWEDRLQATDLKLPDGRSFGCRVRREAAYKRNAHQISFRLRRFSGAKTELAKILGGYCDLYFYGFVDKAEENIISWFIGNMNVFRRAHSEFPLLLRWEDFPPDKPTSRSFWLDSLPPEFIVDFHNHPYAAGARESWRPKLNDHQVAYMMHLYCHQQYGMDSFVSFRISQSVIWSVVDSLTVPGLIYCRSRDPSFDVGLTDVGLKVIESLLTFESTKVAHACLGFYFPEGAVAICSRFIPADQLPEFLVHENDIIRYTARKALGGK